MYMIQQFSSILKKYCEDHIHLITESPISAQMYMILQFSSLLKKYCEDHVHLVTVSPISAPALERLDT